MTTTNNATVTINVFKDNEGDYLVTNSPMIVPGISAFQLKGSSVDAEGGPLTVLDGAPAIILYINVSQLEDGDLGTVEDIAARLEYTLMETSERAEDDKLARVLLSNNDA